jgi:fatty acid desaturase
MTTNADPTRISWYRTPVNRETLAKLNSRSDGLGFVQVLGHLATLALTGGLALYGVGRWPWFAVALMVFAHGTVAAFVINAVHELDHQSVFRTASLNRVFVRVFAFIGWINYEHFYISHVRHHQFTLYPPDDLEVVLPIHLTLRQFFLTGFLNFRGSYDQFRVILRHARGKFVGEWELALYPAGQPEKARPVIRWGRVLLVGHSVVLVLSLAWGMWLVPVLVSLTPLYGGWLFFLCNNTQHIGLQDRVPDFRLCCRTFTVNPVVGYLYWHMNYHTEHHMYAAVPCYRLGMLHRAIRHELPPTPHGLLATWRAIAAILKRQVEEPGYQHIVPLPSEGAAVS